MKGLPPRLPQIETDNVVLKYGPEPKSLIVIGLCDTYLRHLQLHIPRLQRRVSPSFNSGHVVDIHYLSIPPHILEKIGSKPR